MSSRQFYKKIGEVNYDRKLLEKAQRLARANGGTLNVVAVEKLWKDIRSDGKDKDHVDGVWDVELRTIKYIAENFRHDAAASARMQSEIATAEAVRAAAASNSSSGRGGAGTSAAAQRSRRSVYSAGQASQSASSTAKAASSGDSGDDEAEAEAEVVDWEKESAAAELEEAMLGRCGAINVAKLKSAVERARATGVDAADVVAAERQLSLFHMLSESSKGDYDQSLLDLAEELTTGGRPLDPEGAERLVEAALADGAGLAPDMANPMRDRKTRDCRLAWGANAELFCRHEPSRTSQGSTRSTRPPREP